MQGAQKIFDKKKRHHVSQTRNTPLKMQGAQKISDEKRGIMLNTPLKMQGAQKTFDEERGIVFHEWETQLQNHRELKRPPMQKGSITFKNTSPKHKMPDARTNETILSNAMQWNITWRWRDTTNCPKVTQQSNLSSRIVPWRNYPTKNILIISFTHNFMLYSITHMRWNTSKIISHSL
jgi:hypothetical protein